jgi:aromatic ring-opening dioxygenase catalytic subunit (LigB family)
MPSLNRKQQAEASITVYGHRSKLVSLNYLDSIPSGRTNSCKAFDPEINLLDIPVVQVSLFDTEDPNQHYTLGRAVAPLRSENVQIIVSGMAVHNLRDMQLGMTSGQPLPYATSFDKALKEAATANPEERQEKMAALLKRKDARRAHPTFDHLLPIFVGAGAASEEKGVQLWTLPEGSMSWAQYMFGEISARV